MSKTAMLCGLNLLLMMVLLTSSLEAKDKLNRVVFFTAKNCGPCQRFKQTLFLSELKKAGWKVGSSDDSDLQILESEDFNRPNKSLNGYHPNGVPAFIIVRNGKHNIKSLTNPFNFLNNDNSPNWSQFGQYLRQNK